MNSKRVVKIFTELVKAARPRVQRVQVVDIEHTQYAIPILSMLNIKDYVQQVKYNKDVTASGDRSHDMMRRQLLFLDYSRQLATCRVTFYVNPRHVF